MSDRPSPDDVRSATDETARSMTPQRVPVNSYETPGAYVVVAPLPAVTESDVTVELTAEGLRFAAELRSAGPRDYVLHEWEYGGYERHIEIPHGLRVRRRSHLVERATRRPRPEGRLPRHQRLLAQSAYGPTPDARRPCGGQRRQVARRRRMCGTRRVTTDSARITG